MTAQSSVQLTRLENDIACVTLDMPGSAANILSDQMLTELQTCLDDISAMDGLKGLILISAKSKIFVAGANLKEIKSNLDWPNHKIIAFANRGRRIYQAFGAFEFPSVAAIHGACVGGGLELAMGCNYRIGSRDRRTILGLPETNLGLIPGWAGTVRIPRIVGLKKGLELIINGNTFSANEALETGILDQTVETQSELMPAAMTLLAQKSQSNEFRNHLSCAPISISQSEAESIAKTISTPGFAQQVVKRHIVASCTLSFDDACDSEAIAFAETWGSDESRGLLNNFFLGEHAKKNPGFVDLSLKAKAIDQVGIVGAGLMGNGIAAACLKAGKQVNILDSSHSAAIQTAERLGGSEAGIEAIESYDQLSNCDLVIESVVEDLPTKRNVLKDIESACSLDVLVASNTSAIPITELASCMKSPEQFCGIHFCHPGLMKVVEVVRGEQTSEFTIATAVHFARELRKMPLAIKDGPGFVVNRLLSAMLDEAVNQLSYGKAITQIDRALKTFGFSAGPFEMMDIIGLETCLKAGQIMGQRGIERVNDSPIVPRLVKRKRLGRKCLAGFYRYESAEGPPIVDPEVNTILDGYLGVTPFADDYAGDIKGACPISGPILTAMYHEAKKILDAGLVADSRDIDICLIHGLAFPAAKGGLLFWVDGE